MKDPEKKNFVVDERVNVIAGGFSDTGSYPRKGS
jgi:hypothetical protein